MEYRPIDCNFYDFVEIFALQKKVIPILHVDEKGQKVELNSIILDTLHKDKAEWIVLANNRTIRLDRIVSLNGIQNPSFQEK